MEKLIEEFPCRDYQITTLSNLYTKAGDIIPNSVFISGVHAVGKTTLTRRFLELAKIKFIFVNCIECYTHRLLLEPILNKLFPDHFSSDDKCDTFMEFIGFIKQFHSEGYMKENYVLVLDGIEYLEQLGEHYLMVFSKLQELTSVLNLGTIFISHIPFYKFHLDDSGFITLHFNQYTKDELIKILLLEKPEGYNESFYSSYLSAALSVFYNVTRDLTELRQMVDRNFKTYCEPMGKGLLKEEDSLLLWRHAAPHLRNSLLAAYSATGHNKLEDIPENEKEATSVKSVLSFDLPYYTKFFLISAYLASFNSPRYDRRLFMKNHGKQRKTSRINRTDNALSSAELLGPKIFSLDRLLAIFFAIMEDPVSLTANLMSEITTLVELRLLSRLNDNCLEKPKFKCIANFNCVDSVARTVGFNLKKYLLG